MKTAWISLSSVALLAGLIAGCTVPATKQELTPEFSGTLPRQLGVSVIDKRPYVVSGDKDAKFEGLSRSAAGIPWTIDRPDRPEEETFADYLADMLKDTFKQAGSGVAVWRMRVGGFKENRT
jgi:hypothetical protein